MDFKQSKFIEEFSEKAGYLLSYFLFTIIIYLIFSFLNKLPPNWSFFHIMGVTLIITVTGIIIGGFLQ